LVRLHSEGPAEIYLKLENLQPIGSFKLRGASNALALIEPSALSRGVWTASAGNMAQGLAWSARRLGIPCTVVVPDHAPESKLAAIARLGAKTVKVPFDEWWQIIVEHRREGMEGSFVHPVSDPNVIAGNGTIGLELLEDLPDLDAVVVPYGGGGLSTGIAAALQALRPSAQIHAAEVETAAPLARSLQAGSRCEAAYRPSFVDGIGGKTVLEEMWPLVSRLIRSSIVVSLEQVAAAIRLMVERNHVVAEGAGAAGVAAALTGGAGRGKVACVVSGGNIDSTKLCTILSGGIPGFVGVVLAMSMFAGCSSDPRCQDPNGASCARTNAYPTDDPGSICHVCCESNSSRSDAWTELAQTDLASGRFTAVVSQTHPIRGTSSFATVEASRTGEYFTFDDTTSHPIFRYHLFTRGLSDDGNVQVYYDPRAPLQGPVSAAPLNCAIARN